MVCIAAFIILALIGVFVAVISIFKPKVGKAYWKMFKKAWGCLWKKVRLQKCETGFKEDVKNTLLSRVIVKHPKWVKPLSVIIEIISVLIVIIAVWAILTAIKSLLALWALGSCNVTKPSACSLGAEVCSIDESEPNNPLEATGRWFTEWGEIFEAIPDKFRTYNADDYDFNYIVLPNGQKLGSMPAMDIVDSYARYQKEYDFYCENHSSDLELIEGCVEVMGNVVTSQIFKEGNKRTARCLFNAMMISNGIVPPIFNFTRDKLKLWNDFACNRSNHYIPAKKAILDEAIRTKEYFPTIGYLK